MNVALKDISHCFEGVIPASFASCGNDGIPNVAFLSVIQMIDDEHVGLSYQFLNKTKSNIAQNPFVQINVMSPTTGISYRLDAEYIRTETDGIRFNRMDNKIEAAGSLTGTPGLFKLKGIDIYRVHGCESVTSHVAQPETRSQSALLKSVSEISHAISTCDQLEDLLNTALAALDEKLGFGHAMLLLPDEASSTLYAIASRGYQASGAGAEVKMGEGVIGLVAQNRTPIRICQLLRERLMGSAVNQRLSDTDATYIHQPEIPLPGLKNSESVLALPVVARNQLLGVLYLESEEVFRFLPEDEEALGIIANHLATAMLLCNDEPDPSKTEGISVSPGKASDTPLVVKRYEKDNSVFFGHDYLIKGVAGAILWAMLEDYAGHGRVDFSNRELRVDPRLNLPEVSDNLEARLILLRRRLEDFGAGIRMTRTGRGRFRLEVDHTLELRSISSV